MRVALILSVALHVLAAAAFWGWRPARRSLSPREVYDVALVSLPKATPPEPVRSAPQPAKPKPKVDPVPVKKEKPAPQAEDPKPVPEETKTDPPPATADTSARSEAAPSNSVAVQAGDFAHASYLALLRYRVQQAWRPPYQAPGEERRCDAVVRFQVERSGQVIQIELERGSGRFLFDQAALRAIHGLGRLPPLPAEFGGDILNVHIEFESLWQ